MMQRRDALTEEPAIEASGARTPTPYLSLRWKLMIGFALAFTIVFGAACYWFYSFSNRSALDRVHQDLLATLQGAAAGVDVEAVANLVEAHRDMVEANATSANAAGESVAGGAELEALLDWLDVVHDIEPRAWPYIYVPGGRPGEIVFLADLFVRHDLERAAEFGEVYTPATEHTAQGFDRTVLQLEPYSDAWGHWVSGFGPLFGADGEFVAAVGVDFGADHIEDVRAALERRIATAFAVGSVVLALCVFLLAQAFNRPIARLTAAAESIGDGDYQAALALRRRGLRDEISVLTDVFSVMAGKVAQREQTLRREVEHLRIEIDFNRREEQVSEIVETEFFRLLQEKAGTLRKRGSQGT